MPPKSRGNIDVEMKDHRETTDNNPPPSTLAAQLVDNLSIRVRPSKQNDPEDLKGLLEEVQSFSNVPDAELDPETKVEQNHKTIFLFVRLVLEPLTRNDPFLVTAQTLSTSCQALQLLKKTIEETPTVLLHIAAVGSSNDTGGEILWSWLFPRLLTLIGHDFCTASQSTDGSNSGDSGSEVQEILQNEIASFFNLAFQIASGLTTKHGDLGILFFSYLKGCVNGMLKKIVTAI